jgi:hypothetical protein
LDRFIEVDNATAGRHGMNDHDRPAAGDHRLTLVEAGRPVSFPETTHRRAIAKGELEAWPASIVLTQCGSTARNPVGGLSAAHRDKVARLVRQHQTAYDIAGQRRGHEGSRQQRLRAGRRRLAA